MRNVLKMLHGPADEAVHVRHQGFSKRREGILYTRWYLRIGLAPDKTVPLKIFKCGRQHLLGDVAHLLIYLAETKGPAPVQMIQDQQGPFVAETVDDVLDGTLK